MKINIKNLTNATVMTDEEMRNVKGGDIGNCPQGMVYAGDGMCMPISGENAPHVEACKGKDLCASCSWNVDGRTISGECSQNAWLSYRYCSTLRCHT